MATSLQAMNYADEMMAFQLGVSAYPESRDTTRSGDITVNDINVTDCNIGMIHTGNIHGSTIKQSIDFLISDNKKDMADVLKTITEAILNSHEIDDTYKKRANGVIISYC